MPTFDGLRFASVLVPTELRYSRDHQWVRAEGELLRVGITAFAQEALGEVAMVQLRDLDLTVSAGEELGEIEALKAITDVYMPVDAVIIEHNLSLKDSPTSVSDDPYGAGWLCMVQPLTGDDLLTLLDADAYRDLIGLADV